MLTDIVDSKIELIDDKAIDKIKYDALDFDVYAQVLAETILETASPFRVALYGDWGRGKSSLLKFLMNDISSNKKQGNIVNIFCDAWKFESSKLNPLVDLLTMIEKGLQSQRAVYNEDVILNILDYIKYIKIAISKINKENTIFLEKEEDKNIHFLEIYELFKKFEVLLAEEKFLFIFYIDNLDRCSSSNSIKILESINLIFDLKGFSFVFAVNKKLLEKQLENVINDPVEYLSKTIHLPFYIPTFSGKINELLDNIHLKSNLKEGIESSIKDVLHSISFLEELTPRLIIKLINRIKVCSKIYMKLNPNTQLSNDNILSLFAISCILEELFNEFHTLLIRNGTIAKYIIRFTQSEIFYKDELLMNTNILNADKKLLVDSLENNFQVLKMIFSTEQGKYWLENISYRISTYEFLKSNNDITENIEAGTLPLYKTDFSENIIQTEEGVRNQKEFVLIPNRDFEMSRYVVTNKWFEEFILAGGYDNTKYWTDVPSKIWLINNKIYSLNEKYDYMVEKESVYFKKKFNKELLKEDFNSSLQPIVYITYYEAVAFCRYLTDIDGEYEYKIPTKEEWEYVASGGDKKRIYPWGNIWNNNYCNNGTNQLNKTTEIGMFPQGDSKFKISDMIGNVWVWTSTLDNNDYNYLKGGSWNFSEPSYFKISNSQMTFYNNPSYQHYDIGFLCIRRKKK